MSAVAAFDETSFSLPKSGGARAAILLLALGVDGASRVLRHFSADDIRLLNASAAGLAAVAPEAIDELVDNFQDCFKKSPGLDGPERQMAELLQGALGEDEFRQMFAAGDGAIDGAFSLATSNVWEAVAVLDGGVLAPQLAKEHPQVVAVLLSKLPPDTASAVVRQFEAAFRNAVMRRMLSLASLSAPVTTLFETHVRQAYLGTREIDDGNTGGHSVLAEIVNRLERSQGEELIESIRAVEPRDAETLLKLLFAFDDIVSMPQKGRLKLFDSVPTDVVILALRGAEGEVRELALASLGARGRRMVEAELAQDVDIRAEDIDGARRRIAAEALRLSSDGSIELRAREAEAEA